MSFDSVEAAQNFLMALFSKPLPGSESQGQTTEANGRLAASPAGPHSWLQADAAVFSSWLQADAAVFSSWLQADAAVFSILIIYNRDNISSVSVE